MKQIDINQILHYLPHRYPFLLVDRITEIEEGKRIVGIKNITFNEPCFTGHFPGKPVFPGVLILEAMAQTAAILAFETENHRPDESSEVYYVGIDQARFRRPVIPGDQLVMEVHFERAIRTIWKYRGTASVDGDVAVEATFMCALKLNK